MVSSRLSRVQEKSARKRIVIGLLGSVAIIVIIAVFGLKLLIAFRVLVERIRGGGKPVQQTTSQSVLVPPVLDPLPEATNSATITISGSAVAKDQVGLYINSAEYKRITVPDTGSFQFTDIPVDVGTVTASAKLIDTKQNTSDISNVITTTVDRTIPKLTIDSPSDNTTVNDGTHQVQISGLTDPNINVSISGRIVVVKADGSFIYSMPLNNGANKLEIVATDDAGNSTTVERNITYQP